MKSILLLFIASAFGVSLSGQDYSIDEVHYYNASIELYADVYSPNEPKSRTGIAIIQGSGNSDRSNGWSAAFAAFLAENGYFVLLPDKRGCGKSEGSWKQSSFEELAEDAIASVHHLKSKFDLESVGLLGLSQGGFIAPVAASKTADIDFVINVVGTSVTLEEQIIHEVANTARKEGLSPQEIAGVLELHVLMKQYAFDRDWETLGDRFAALENSSWSEFAQTFPSSPDIWVWDWIAKNIDFNPMNYWKKVEQDVFIAYGSKDQHDNMPVYESVYRLQNGFREAGKQNYQIEIYETGHAMYEDDRAELRKEFLDDILHWLESLQSKQ